MKKRKQGSKQLKKNTAEIKISRILYQARLAKNYSLDDLYKITKIKPQYLKAVETGDFNKLPGGFYVRAFIKKYADVVGVNGSELLKRYNNMLPDLQDPQYMNSVSEDKLMLNAEKQRIRTRHSTIRKYIPLISLIIIIMLVLVGIWIGAAHYHNGLTTNFHEHATSISGARSSKPVHKKYRSRSRKKKTDRKLIIRRRSSNNDQNKYQIITHHRAIQVKLMDTQPVQISLDVNGKTKLSTELKASRAKVIKVPNDAKQLRINVSNGSLLNVKINKKLLKLSHKQSLRSIILKITK